jgi:photosystem II stability/assembly factor-like uncharacterized protein
MTRSARQSSFSIARSLTLLLLCAAVGVSAAADDPGPVIDPDLYQAMEYRLIGPFRGGRVTAVAGVIGERDTFYMGSTGGGVWKTTDGGESWSNVSDEFFESASVGAIAVAPSDPNVVYAGMGSACIRGNISPGDGVYRSTDAGKTWKRAGLAEAGQIGAIAVHPKQPETLHVAALGHAFGPSEQRGVFRSRDGGDSWEQVLHVSDRAGAVDLALDPTNPRIVYAAIWQAERKPWGLVSGGEGSGLHRSVDGGDSWQELTEGLPRGIKGRIGVTVSGAMPGRVWALVEAEDGGLYRSDDGGDSFRLVNADRNFRQRAWYYTHVYADPRDADTVYILNVGMWRSSDGGESFDYVRAPHGDHHALWINPDQPEVMINGNDGGANVSVNGGKSWSTQANQPTAEFYRVTVDEGFPYRVYGSQQDNSTVSIPSRTTSGSIGRQHWYDVGGCESGHIAVDPRDTNIVYAGCYGGSITRHDHATGQTREINAYPETALGRAARDLRYRFQWNAPIRLSPHDPDLLYHASQFVHRSADGGQTWQVISPDLTRNERSKQALSGGPITKDNTGVEVYGTIFALEPSPLQEGLLWAGSDDGLVHLSRDDGQTWSDITPKRMPEWGQVNAIELSAHGAGRAFLAVTRYRDDDFRPYIFRTDDFGGSWTLLTDGENGIPANHFVRVIREDPERKGLLYAGTEFGLYVSFDDGRHWQSLQLNLPVTPVTDLAVKEGDLVVATQGRSFWILDDLSPLRQLTGQVAAGGAFLFQPRPVYLLRGGSFSGGGEGAGQNPPGGAILHYLIPGETDESLTLEILDGEENLLRAFSSEKEEPRAPNPWAAFMPPGAIPTGKLEKKKGMNRFVWDLRLPDARLVEGTVLWGQAAGPVVPPGNYTARLSRGEWSQTRTFEVLADPRLEITPGALRERFDLSRKIWQALSETHDAVLRMRDVRDQVDGLARRLAEAGRGEGVEATATAVRDKLAALEDRLIQARAESAQDVLNHPPRLDGQWIGLLGVVESADAPPTAGALERYGDLRSELDGLLVEIRAVLETELTAFNDVVRAKDLPPVIVP